MSQAKILAALIIFALLHVTQGKGNRGRLYRRPNPFKPTFLSNDKEMVMAHNMARNKMNLPGLQWDNGVASYAKNWALQRVDDCAYLHHSYGPYGENTYWEQYDETTPFDAVRIWFEEQKLYDYQRNVCNCNQEMIPDCTCNHFLQLVSKNVQRIGCGTVTCNKGRGILTVCSYDPR